MSTDVLISFDTTGSMSPCIAEVRRRVYETVGTLLGKIDNLRIGIISHGDYCDRDRCITAIDFTSDLAALTSFLHGAPNTNGGDSDECYELVLQTARRFDWQAENRAMILIADALPHAVGYHYGGNTYTLDWKEEAFQLSEIGVHVFAVEALGTRNARYFYQPLADMTNGRMLELNQFSEAVETIIAISYYATGDTVMVETYKTELEADFKMNRNLANLFAKLGSSPATFVEDHSGLEPVPPARFQILNVDAITDIKSFVTSRGTTFRKGRGFYQFTKTEEIQPMKEVVLRHKYSGDMFTGAAAREFIGLPFGNRGRIRPGYFEDYEVYIQSTSVNRKLMPNTKFLYENESA